MTDRGRLAVVRRRWPGADDGFAVLIRLIRLDEQPGMARLNGSIH
jgi:hypothetical protein